MRKYAVFAFCITLLTVGIAFAQTPREGKSSEGKTTFTNMAVVGLDKNGTNGSTNPGLPGYVEMVSTKGDTFYLYIGYDGKLRCASEVAVGFGASPSIVSWRDASAPLVRNQ